MSAGSSPAGIAATRSRTRLPDATRCARSIASRPARSASSASTISSVCCASSCTCCGVIAVPITATVSVIPAWCAASTSVYPSTTTARPAFATARRALSIA